MGLFEEIRKLNIEVSRGEPMSRHTSFRIGGPADLFARPKSAAEMAALIKLATEWQMPYFVIGRGSNLLVGDGGIKKLVIATEGMSYVHVEGESVTCGAVASLTCVAAVARDSALSGLEFAYGIPGSVGGAVFMNAGAYGSQMADVVCSVRMLPRDGAMEPKTFSGREMEFGYRESILKRKPYIVDEVVFELYRGYPEEIEANMKALNKKRVEKQPLEYPSAGSTFKRPEGSYASLLIDQCGLKGYRVGGAQVSSKHAGFVINRGDATYADVMAVCAHVQETVKAQTGYDLELEPEILDA